MKTGRLFIAVASVGVYLFLLAPIVIVIFASLTPSPYLKFPIDAVSLKWYQNIFQVRGFVESFFTSLTLATTSTLLSMVSGTMAAIALSRYRVPGKAALLDFLLSPLTLPAIAFGFAMLQSYALMGGVDTMAGLLLAHLVITLPYVVRSVYASLLSMPTSLEEAAGSLGANGLQTFWRVTMPNIKPGMIAGGLFAFLISFDDVTVSLFLSGPRATPLSIRMLTYIEFSLDPTIAAISVVLILITVMVMLLLERVLGLDVFLKAY